MGAVKTCTEEGGGLQSLRRGRWGPSNTCIEDGGGRQVVCPGDIDGTGVGTRRRSAPSAGSHRCYYSKPEMVDREGATTATPTWHGRPPSCRAGGCRTDKPMPGVTPRKPTPPGRCGRGGRRTVVAQDRTRGRRASGSSLAAAAGAGARGTTATPHAVPVQ